MEINGRLIKLINKILNNKVKKIKTSYYCNNETNLSVFNGMRRKKISSSVKLIC